MQQNMQGQYVLPGAPATSGLDAYAQMQRDPSTLARYRSATFAQPGRAGVKAAPATAAEMDSMAQARQAFANDPAKFSADLALAGRRLAVPATTASPIYQRAPEPASRARVQPALLAPAVPVASQPRQLGQNAQTSGRMPVRSQSAMPQPRSMPMPAPISTQPQPTEMPGRVPLSSQVTGAPAPQIAPQPAYSRAGIPGAAPVPGIPRQPLGQPFNPMFPGAGTAEWQNPARPGATQMPAEYPYLPQFGKPFPTPAQAPPPQPPVQVTPFLGKPPQQRPVTPRPALRTSTLTPRSVTPKAYVPAGPPPRPEVTQLSSPDSVSFDTNAMATPGQPSLPTLDQRGPSASLFPTLGDPSLLGEEAYNAYLQFIQSLTSF